MNTDTTVIDVTPTSVSVVPADKASLQRDAQHWSEQVAVLNIASAQDSVQASYLLRSIKGVRHDIQAWFAPHLDAAMETKRKAEAARKALADDCDRMQAPLVVAENTVKRALLAWEQEQERLRREEEARLQKAAQDEAERATLAAAAALELEAVKTGDAEMLKEAESYITDPIEAPVVEVKRFVPKVQGVSYRDNWKAHSEVDVKTLAAAVASGAAPVTFLVPNMTAINQWARATQGSQKIPGVRVVNDRQIAARG